MAVGSHPSRIVRSIPNVLSAMRLAIAAIFAWLAPPLRPFAVIAAGVSDGLDGWIARRFHAASWIGGLLDAVADKAFVLSVLGTFVYEDRIEPWQAGLLLLRDIVVLAAAAYLLASRQWHGFTRMPSRWWGKATTATLFVFFLAVTALPSTVILHGILLALAAAASGLAAFDYAQTFFRARSSARSPS